MPAHPSTQPATRPSILFDPLEARVLLSGDDHADYPDFGNATALEFEILEWTEEVTAFLAYPKPQAGVIDSLQDSDMFKFVAPGHPDELSAVFVASKTIDMYCPTLKLYDGEGTLLAGGIGDHSVHGSVNGLDGESWNLETGDTYYLAVEAQGDVGPYNLGVFLLIPGSYDDFSGGGGGGDDGGNGDGGGDDGGGGGGAPNDDFPDRAELPWPLEADSRTADATMQGAIEAASDTDAFSITAPADGPVRVQLLTDDPGYHGDLMVFTADGLPIATADRSRPGAEAAAEFVGVAGEEYTVVVSGRDGSTGGYTLEIDASPEQYHYYYPAGYSSHTIDEYVPMVNPNPFPVEYTVYAHYEVGDPLQVLAAGTMRPNARGGITVTDRRNPGGSLTRVGVPYAFEIVASGPIGANLGHYDFGATTGEAFTDKLDTRWEFPEVVRADGMRDLLVYYNPNPTPIDIAFTILDENGIMHRFTRSLDAQRRGGINFHTDRAVPSEGAFAVWLEAELPIVAAQTTFDAANARGDGHLGQPGGGALAGAFPGFTTEAGVETSLALVNSTGETATVRFTSPAIATYSIVHIQPRSRISLRPSDIGFADGVSAPLSYTSTAPVTARVIQYRNGDGDAFLAATRAGMTFLNGAAWVNPRTPGVYIERLGLVNPAREATEVTITFLFTDGTTATDTLTLDAGAGTAIAIDEHDAIVSRGKPTAFSLRVDAATPILASFVHYDLYLDGGWGTLAAPVGLTVPIAAMTR